MPKIFISYRRDDSAGMAGRIYDRLEARFGRENRFMDIDAMPLGVDFREHLHSAVGQCDVLLAVIGRNWFGRTAEGTRGWMTRRTSSGSRSKQPWPGTSSSSPC
jgi:hypothetical protein